MKPVAGAVLVAVSMMHSCRALLSGAPASGLRRAATARRNLALGVSAAPPVALMDQTILSWVEGRVSEALASALGEEYRDVDAMVQPATKPEFGDYQCNAALPLAKRVGDKPRDVANKLVAALDLGTMFEAPDIAGPGFINLRLTNEFVAAQCQAMLADPERLAAPKAATPQRIVVDFSSPNIAKEMHVGHLRSTIIGDTLCRVLSFQGHDVVRLNHVGDWGTQFGMLISHLQDSFPGALDGEEVDIGDLVVFYKEAKVRFDEDPAFAERSRQAVVTLQSGDESSLKAWSVLCETSRQEFQKIYDLLDVQLEERGESFYNPLLQGVIDKLEETGLAEESDGALCVFLEGFKSRDGGKQPLLVRKSDGGFMYSTTDLAAIQHRVEQEKCDRALYVVDSGQATHFNQVFQVARRAGIVPESVTLQHVPFGLVQGEDGKKFKTRAGDTVKLKDLLDEAVRIASEDMKSRLEENGQEFDEAAQAAARTIGLGAVKYADLSLNRESNYRFSYQKMLALNGNTAPYMLYAFARIQGIRRKVEETHGLDASSATITVDHPAEAALARQLLRLPEVLARLESDLCPNLLCDFLFETSQRFNQFYEQCPVNTAETAELRASRAALCATTAQLLARSLDLLGIGVVDRL